MVLRSGLLVGPPLEFNHPFLSGGGAVFYAESGAIL
jgi:hypothetical protein